MALIETGQPASISRQQLCELLRSLGLDPNLITEDGIHIGMNGITCEVVALDEAGKTYPNFIKPNDIATHTISIPITD